MFVMVYFSSYSTGLVDLLIKARTGDSTVEVPSSRIVIIEGIYALSDRLRPLLDLRVSVRGGVHFDLVKRVIRDIQRAGQEPEEIIHQISETVQNFPFWIFSFLFLIICGKSLILSPQYLGTLQVYPMYKAFIEPDLQTAHIKIINKFNPFTGFQSPTYILKVNFHFFQFHMFVFVLIASPFVIVPYLILTNKCCLYCSQQGR